MGNRKDFIDKLQTLSKEELIEKYIAVLIDMNVYDYITDLEHKLYEKEQIEMKNEREFLALKKELLVKNIEIANLEQKIKGGE